MSSSHPFSENRMTKAVKVILIANLAVFILQKIFPGVLESFFGLVPELVWSRFQVWRLFTYSFLHAGLFHIFINSLMLWMFGKELENVWGTNEFLRYYFLCTAGAAVLNTAVEPFSSVPVIGASGALYGLLAAFAVTFPEAVIYVYAVLPMRSKHFVIMMAVFEFFASFDGISSGIARFAHLGGMLTGFLYLKSYEFRSVLRRVWNRAVDSVVERKVEKDIKTDATNLDREVDRILEKVLLKGPGSLTDKEREVMRRYSSKKH